MAKRRARSLAWIALVVLIMHWVDLLWLTAPAFHPSSFYLHWLDLAALIAVGGLWIGAFAHYLGATALLPNDPRFVEALREAEAT
jgi:hypothetical protein